MEIKRICASDLFSDPSFHQSVLDYSEESGNPELLPANPQTEHYKHIEEAGLWRVCAAYEDEKLVGYVTVTATTSLHYGKTIAAIDAIWLDKAYRKGASGLKLIRHAQALAREMNAVLLIVTAPTDSRLSRLFNRIGRKTDDVFSLNVE